MNTASSAESGVLQVYSNSATAKAAMPSPRPVKPRPSEVFGFTLMLLMSIASARAMHSRISPTCGDSRGRSAMTVASTFITDWPASFR